jgi:hypothetical protein
MGGHRILQGWERGVGGRDRWGGSGKWHPQWSHYRSEGGGLNAAEERSGPLHGARGGRRGRVGQKGRMGRLAAGPIGPKAKKNHFRIKIGFLNLARLWKFAQGDL